MAREHPLPDDADALDRLVFGSEGSESAHSLSPETSRVCVGQHDTACRRIHFPDGHDVAVGSVSFTMECDPDRRTYLTVKLNADPPVPDGLGDGEQVVPFLFDGTDQVGYTLGREDWPTLTTRSFGLNSRTDRMVPGSKADWVYYTTMLPETMSADQETVDLRLATWTPTDQDDKNSVGAASVPLFRVYTHTDPLFSLPEDESDTLGRDVGTPDGRGGDPAAPLEAKAEAMVEAGQRQDTVGADHFRGTRAMAMAYSRDWIETLDRDALFETVRDTIDEQVRRQARDDIDPDDIASHAHNWHAHGALARSFELLSEAYAERDSLGEAMPDHPDAPITRREAYTDFFRRAYDWRQGDRRRNTNQVMFVHLGLVEMGEALQVLDTERAPADEEIDRWVDEGFGIEPMTVVPDRPDRVKPVSWEIDDGEEPHNLFDYLHEAGAWHATSKKGLTREPRYSSGYGTKVLTIPHILVRHTTDEDRAKRVKERLSASVEAMGEFRSLAKSLVPNRETTVAYQEGPLGSRGRAYPGAMNAWQGYGAFAPAYAEVLGEDDEVANRWAELLLEHGRHDFWAGEESDEYPDDRYDKVDRMIWMKEGIEALEGMDDSTYDLPWERERSVWADHTAGMVNVVDGDHRLVVSLGHNNRTHNSNTVRFDYEGPDSDRIGTTMLRRKEIPLYETRERGNNLDAIGDGYRHTDTDYYFPWTEAVGNVNQSLRGAEIELAARPNGEPWPGTENPIKDPGNHFSFKREHEMAGLIYFYREARVGPYLIGMNATGARAHGFGPGRTFEMDLPVDPATDLASGEQVAADSVTVRPESTRVFKLETR